MTIRPYFPSDREAFMSLHERHGDFWFADPEDPLHPVTLVAEEDGKLVGAITGRACLEAFMMLDPKWGTPRDRMELVNRLMDEGGLAASESGYREVHVATPLKRFALRLSKLPFMHIERRFRLILDLFGKHVEVA